MSDSAPPQKGCLVWTRDKEGDEVSSPTVAPGESFLYSVRTDAGGLDLVKVSAQGELQWRSEVMADASALDAGMLPVPAVSTDGMSALATAQGVALFHADGKSATESGELVDLAESGAAVKGAVTLCAGGSAYAQVSGQSDDFLYAIPAGKSGIPFSVGELPAFGNLAPEIGPVIFKSLGLAVLPVEGGSRLAGADMAYDVVDEKGHLSERWVYPDSPFPEPIAGLAADAKPKVYVATRSGVVHALFADAENDLAVLHWQSTAPADGAMLPIELPPMVSKVGTESRVYLAGRDGTVFYVSFIHPKPVVVAKFVDGPARASLLREDRGAVAAITGDGVHKLTFAVSADSIPALNESPGAYVHRSWTMACSTFGFSTPLPNGVIAVACDGRSLGLVAPDYTSPSTTWPTSRGPGNNGCIE